jgi:hypothetical protein
VSNLLVDIWGSRIEIGAFPRTGDDFKKNNVG